MDSRLLDELIEVSVQITVLQKRAAELRAALEAPPKRGRPSGGTYLPDSSVKSTHAPRRLSEAGRQAIADAQRARWAAKKAAEAQPVKVPRGGVWTPERRAAQAERLRGRAEKMARARKRAQKKRAAAA